MPLQKFKPLSVAGTAKKIQKSRRNLKVTVWERNAKQAGKPQGSALVLTTEQLFIERVIKGHERSFAESR
jgi:hypothetical protein